jgi:HlyD family secretion protein
MGAHRFAAAFMAILALTGCSKSDDRLYQGWVEGDLLFIGPDEAGRLETLSIREGQKVETGTPLFSLDTELHLADIETAEAALTNAKQDWERAKTLFEKSSGPRTTVEDTEAALRTAQARLNSAQTRLARRKLASPDDGLVQEIYIRRGEYVLAGRPVVSVLPLSHVKIRFFVPETVLGGLAVGDDISVHCDGCKEDLPGKVTFISQHSEFTPPVIYSLEERSKLVYLIEARTEKAGNLRVGQPVDVRFTEKPK